MFDTTDTPKDACDALEPRVEISKGALLSHALAHRLNERSRAALEFATFDQKIGRIRQEIVMGMLATDCGRPLEEIESHIRAACFLLCTVEPLRLPSADREEFGELARMHRELVAEWEMLSHGAAPRARIH